MDYWQLLGFLGVAILFGLVKAKMNKESTDSPDKRPTDQRKG